jgi:hypothetical protein
MTATDRHSFAKLFQRRTFGTEHGAQDRADGDAQHRLERFELAAFGPGRDLARHLFFDDAVVAAHPLAVKRRRQQFAAQRLANATPSGLKSRRCTPPPTPDCSCGHGGGGYLMKASSTFLPLRSLSNHAMFSGLSRRYDSDVVRVRVPKLLQTLQFLVGTTAPHIQ